MIEKAREAAATYLESLPNYFCQQMTARYQSDHPKTGWDAIDVVTADVAYEDGRETYKNIKIGNKATGKSMDDIGGTRSTGEFSSILLDLLDPNTDAIFRRTGTDTITGRAALVYKYEVPRERSHWRVEAPSQLYYPAHGGSIWFDKETSRVLRIEQKGTLNMPKLFPFDTVETVTDYAFIPLAAGVEIPALPADAEVLSCMRGTSLCTRNRLEFRNYRKFGADSSITFRQQAIVSSATRFTGDTEPPCISMGAVGLCALARIHMAVRWATASSDAARLARNLLLAKHVRRLLYLIAILLANFRC